MAQGHKTKMISLKSLMHRSSFVKGFNEALSGKPMDYDLYNDGRQDNDRFAYERGRQFACLYKGKIKNNKKVCWDALDSMRNAVYSNIII